MSSSNHGKSKKSSNEQQSRAGQIGATAAHTEQTRIEQLFSNEDFPTPAEAVTQRTTTSTSNQKHRTALLSTQQAVPLMTTYGINNTTVPFGLMAPQPRAINNRRRRNNPSSTTRERSESNASSTTLNANTTTENNSAGASSVPPPPPLSPREQEIYKKLCEIILMIHKGNEFVSRERVEQELFRYYRVESWHEMKARPAKFIALMNLNERQKSVNLYLRIFEQTFNLCTLNDLGSLIARFMKVERYDDLQLGPIDKHPDVIEIFKYKPNHPNQPIPNLTTGDVIKKFMNFQSRHRRQQKIPFENFLDSLVEELEIQSREELGLFCKSFPYLVQVTNALRRDLQYHVQEAEQEASNKLIEDIRLRLEEFKKKMQDELEFSSFNKKKTPTAVLNYLTSIVEQYLTFIPQQTSLYAILVELRENELFRCLMNLSIYLGTLEKPEVFVAELKRQLGYQDNYPATSDTSTIARLSTQAITEKMSKKDRRKMKAMMEQQNLQASVSNTILNEQSATTANTTLANPVNTTFSSSFFTTNFQKPQMLVPFKQLCSDIYENLVHHDTPLTIKQLAEVDEKLCNQHGVHSFSAFTNDESGNGDYPDNLISFLNKYRRNIDPHDELSVYEQITSRDHRTELYSFIQQLSIINNDAKEHHEAQRVSLTHGHINTEQVLVSAETLSITEKAIKHKFGPSMNLRIGNQIIKKIKKRSHKNKANIIQFEESLLDPKGLNQLDDCPTSLDINELQLRQLILHCPLMTDLQSWLQWKNFFQSKYGTLHSFISKHERDLKDLRFLETSTGEIYRLPNDTNLKTFENELKEMHIRSAVAHLCSLILQEGQFVRFPIRVYQPSMETWFYHLQSLAMLKNDHIDPMEPILEFLMHLPLLIGQSRILEELILAPLDKVFNDFTVDTVSARTKLWNIANAQQRIKLEAWGHMVNIEEWKNKKKWIEGEHAEERFVIRSEKILVQHETINSVVKSDALTTTTDTSLAITTNTTDSNVPSSTSVAETKDANNYTETAARRHIETIRRNFGVDHTLDETSQTIINNLLNALKRSLQRLSTDLYVEQGHFVLELIQNADDNQYLTDCTPTLHFTLSPERIRICNNEIGFQHDHITAICNVGASTKGKHKQGYAGHKGIGFKSVFMVSDRPEVHSGNYHICFDTSNPNHQNGYIVPIWLDKCEEALPNLDEWTTCIRLPIKKEANDSRLRENFTKIESTYLLFLNRLRKIEIINRFNGSETNDNHRMFTRIDHAEGKMIELQEKTKDGATTSNLWLVVKKTIEVPDDIKKKLSEVKSDVDKTIIAMACPLNGLQDSVAFSLPAQRVFAYLPLCSYGFRFVLQADFEVPANRSEILHDNLWNEWLKSEMSCLLSLAYEEFQHLPDLLSSLTINTKIKDTITPIQIIKYFLKFLPLRNESKPFFNKFVDQSVQLLKGIIKLPVSHQNEGGEIGIDWVSPSQCIIVHDQFIRKVLTQDLLLTHFNSYYVDEELVRECDEHILLKLGCRQLDFADITRLIEISYNQKEQQHVKTPSSIEQVAQWLACLDYSLQQQREDMNYKDRENETINKLRGLKIIPLKNQSNLAAADEFEKQTISFPLDKSARYSKHLKLVLEDTPTIDEQLLNIIEDKFPRRADSIRTLIQSLGITKQRRIQDIYRQHMLPIMSDQSRWSSKSDAVLIAYLLCIYEYIYSPNPNQFESEFKILQKQMIIKTRNNKLVSLGSPDVIVHLTTKYGCKTSLESLKIPNYQFLFISDDYVNELVYTDTYKSNFNIYDFVRFLYGLNISEFLQVIPNQESFMDVKKLDGTKWSYLIPSLSEMIYEPFIIRDYCCNEFDKLVSPSDNNQMIDPALCIQLLQYLDSQFRYHPEYYTASIMLLRSHKFGHETPIKGIESSFCLSLRQYSWIPVYDNILLKPGDVYLLNNDPNLVFQRYIPHVDCSKVSLNNPEFIHNILGIKSKVEHRTMFELLIKWSCNLDSESLWNLGRHTNTLEVVPCTLPKTFRQSCSDKIENFRQIYNFLASNDDTTKLLRRFRLWPIIFVPRSQDVGDFLFVERTFWNDPSTLLSSQDTVSDPNGRLPIQSYYEDNSKLNSLFLDILQVPLHPTIDDYIPLLLINQDINKIWQIIAIITKIAIEQNKQKEVREKCADIAFIPCIGDKQKLAKYTDPLYYPHDPEIADEFSDDLLIIRLPGLTIRSFQEQFRSLFTIRSLASIIQTKIDVENEGTSTSLMNFYSSSVDLIQHFLLSKQWISPTRSNYLASVFSRMQFVCVDHISLSYCLRTGVMKSAPKTHSKDTYIDEKEGKFYILKKFEKSEMRHIDTIASFIVEDEDNREKLSTYIKKLLKSYEDNGEEGLVKLREQIKADYDPKWIIPKEIKKKEVVVPVLVPSTIVETQKPEVKREEIQRLMAAPSIRPNPQPKKVTDDGTTKTLTSFPAPAAMVESTKPPDEGNQKPKLHANDQHHHKQESEPSVRHITNDESKNDTQKDEKRTNNDQSVQPNIPIIFSDSRPSTATNFERIIVTNLMSVEPSTSSLADELPNANSGRPSGTDADRLTGRIGEEFVFNYLKWKYPNEEIKWVNKDAEYGTPYDIHLVIKSEQNREEFIEVKTTRARNQNSFPLSIGEIEYLLANPSNYFIYRVYYSDNIDATSITIINRVRSNLETKHLKLFMAYEPKN